MSIFGMIKIGIKRKMGMSESVESLYDRGCIDHGL